MNPTIQDTKPANPDLINASPTKDFFISMLVRDLSLRDAIGDLVDNSVDSVRTLVQDDSYDGIRIDIILSKDIFSIVDNCGGIEVSTAREYAFRFGRPAEFSGVKGSIGQFGIGMKRALFKLGRQISIESVATKSSFEIDIDVDSWAENEKVWDFAFKTYSEGEANNRKSRGTKILVGKLKEDVISDFSSNNFIKKLALELEFEHLYPLSKGLIITVNGSKLKKRSLELLSSDEIKPAYFEQKFTDKAQVRIWAGIGESILEEGGWYIFGNSRLILGPEQTEITGWTGGKGTDGGPKYHGQYQRFRGYVFFEADNADLLPWNTSKNGVDIDSPKYKFVRQRMIELMKPIVNFLNQMKQEREGDPSPDELYLQRKVSEAVKVEVTDRPNTSSQQPVFVHPAPQPKSKTDQNVKITYTRNKEQVEKAKKILSAGSYKEVGERTFEYFFDSEVE